MPTKLAFEPSDLSPLAEQFLQSWQEAHGTRSGSVSLLIGEDSFALVIEDAFSQSEHTLAARPEGHTLLQQYTEGLLGHVYAQLIPKIETRIGCRIISTATSPNPRAGWVMAFFKLAKD
jgi:uncharacterized protein YbcI